MISVMQAVVERASAHLPSYSLQYCRNFKFLQQNFQQNITTSVEGRTRDL